MSDAKNTETLDKLYLEWSQFTEAKTQRELFLERRIKEISEAGSWEGQAAEIELLLADIENREPERFALDWLDR